MDIMRIRQTILLSGQYGDQSAFPGSIRRPALSRVFPTQQLSSPPAIRIPDPSMGSTDLLFDGRDGNHGGRPALPGAAPICRVDTARNLARWLYPSGCGIQFSLYRRQPVRAIAWQTVRTGTEPFAEIHTGGLCTAGRDHTRDTGRPAPGASAGRPVTTGALQPQLSARQR